MSANRIGRVIYLDAAGTYNALYDAKEFVDLEMVVLTDTTASETGTLTLYANIVATDDTKNIGSFSVVGIASDQFSFPWRADMAPMSSAGLTAVLAGAHAKAWIYVV